MTLHFEILKPGTDQVVRRRIFNPGEGSTISNNRPDGVRELYVFGCSADNKFSLVQKSTNAQDFLLSRTERFVPAPTELSDVVTLYPDQSFAISVVTDRGTSTDVRLTHKLP